MAATHPEVAEGDKRAPLARAYFSRRRRIMFAFGTNQLLGSNLILPEFFVLKAFGLMDRLQAGQLWVEEKITFFPSCAGNRCRRGGMVLHFWSASRAKAPRCRRLTRAADGSLLRERTSLEMAIGF